MTDNRISDNQSFKGRRANVCPGHGRSGRHPDREEINRRLAGHQDPGMFGVMFPNLEALHVEDAKLQALAEAMLDSDPESSAGDNDVIPAGFTYLGQFVDHDITLDLTPLSDKKRDPLAVENFRSPALDLDSVYGLGPDGSPHLYDRSSEDPFMRGPKLLLGSTIQSPGAENEHPNDLPRSPEGTALTGDPRNDENLLVAQTHVAFLKFHNAVCDMLLGQGRDEASVFGEAREIVMWHYQYMVLHDWVDRLCGEGCVARILHDGRKFYRFKQKPYMPVEFSAAAYRLGHSMVRECYNHNCVFPRAGLSDMFDFTGLRGEIIGDLAPDDTEGPLPVSNLPSNWIIDWRRYHELERPEGIPRNPARLIDPLLVPELHDLEGGHDRLSFRNLKRGVTLGLPSGQAVAEEMKIGNPLTPDEIATGPDGEVARQHGLHEKTPLWYYILKEAQVREYGRRLGPVGATIVSEVFVGLVHGDHQSYLWQQGLDWKPHLASKVEGKFTMADLLRFVDDINPVGDDCETVLGGSCAGRFDQ